MPFEGNRPVPSPVPLTAPQAADPANARIAATSAADALDRRSSVAPSLAYGDSSRDAGADSLAEALGPLWFVRHRITIVPRSPLVLPLMTRGSVLRGAFGITLRRLVCHDLTLACRACPLEATCPYPQTFEPRPPAGAERLSALQDVARPFVFDPPTDEQAEFAPGTPVTFGLVTVGRASRLVPYFVSAFRNLADEGLGPRRAPFDLAEVAALDARGTPTALYQSTSPLVRLAAPTLRAADLVRPSDAERTRVTLRFVTPLELKDQGAPVHRPELGAIVRRLRDRANMLSTFFADAPLALDFRGLSALADGVRLLDDRTRPVHVSRRSSRTGQRHDVGGLLGEATYEGSGIATLMPLLRLGEAIHVGKHAAFGNGRVGVL